MSTVLKVWRDPKQGDQYQSVLNLSNYQEDITALDSYKVRFADNYGTPSQAKVAFDGTTTIPRIGSANADGLICTRVFPKRSTQHPTIFEVQVEFKNVPPAQSGKQNVNISVTPSIYEQDAWFDADNNPIQNSAGDRYNPTLKKAYYDADIQVTFDCDGSTAQAAINAGEACEGKYSKGAVTMTVNGVTKTYGAGTILFLTTGYSTIYTGVAPYSWKMNYHFRYRADGWKNIVIDRGLRENVGGKMVPICSAGGVRVSEPVNLDGTGLAAAPGVTKTQTYDMYGGADFTALLEGIA